MRLHQTVERPDLDIDGRLTHELRGLFVGTVDGVVVATVMAGDDEHRGCVNHLAIDPDRRGGGLGAAMSGAAEQHLAASGRPKVNLQIRTSNLDAVRFYRSDRLLDGRRRADGAPPDR